VERRCIDELLRRIDSRKVRDEACVRSQRGERKKTMREADKAWRDGI
jgi:hypothetical protein